MSKVRFTTTLGDFVVELDEEKAPVTCANFRRYVEDGFYDGLIFHRVIPGFMVQGGGFMPDMMQPATREPIENEARNGLKNERGTIAMARTADPHSATAQFFINVKDNAFLDHPGHDGWGYAVFGRVVEGMETVDRIEQVPTTTRAGHQDVPVEPVVIEKAELID